MLPGLQEPPICFGPTSIYEEAENQKKRLSEIIKQIEEGKVELGAGAEYVGRLLSELDVLVDAARYVVGFITDLGANLDQPLLTFLRRVCIVPGLGAWAAMSPTSTGYEIYLDKELALRLGRLREQNWAIAALNFALWHELTHLEYNTKNMAAWLADLSLLKTKYSQEAMERIGEVLMEILVNEKVYTFYTLGSDAGEPLVRWFAMNEPYKFIMPLPGVFWGVCHTDVLDVSKTYLDKARELAKQSGDFARIFVPYFERGDICYCVQDWFANVRPPTTLTDIINLLTTDIYLEELLKKTDYKEDVKLIHAKDLRFDELVFLVAMTCRVDLQTAINMAKDLVAKNALIYRIVEGKLTLHGKGGGSCEWPYKNVQMYICGGGTCENEEECKRKRRKSILPPIDKPPAGKPPGTEAGVLDSEFKLRRLRLIPEQPQSEPVTGLEGTPERPKWIER